MANEKYSEALVLQEMRCGLGCNDFGSVFPQGDVPAVAALQELLKKAGGKPAACALGDFSQGGSGKARPEFIVTFDADPDTIMVVECKKSERMHSSPRRDRPRDFAVDGALYYAKFLKEGYNVVAVAVSGTTRDKCRVGTFYWPKGQADFAEWPRLNILLEPANYLRYLHGERIARRYSIEEIRQTAIRMSNALRVAKVTANDKPIFIAGILIALQDADFERSYDRAVSLRMLTNQIGDAISEVLRGADVKQDRIDNILNTFRNVASLHHFNATPMGEDYSLRWYIQELDLKIRPMMNVSDSSIDALGEFYSEFIKFSNGDDGKALGIVLTPQHLTDFMCDVSGLGKDSRVVDICAGSGGFLVTAMSKMFRDANPDEMQRIRREGLYGIEADPHIYTLCVANMIVRRDGKSNMHYGSCFDDALLEELRGKNIDVGLINPPYSQGDHNELEFVERLLSVLTPRGVAVAVVPINCALGTTCRETRERLFAHHTLDAVFSMPTEIFNPAASAPPCVMVWTAKVPHDPARKTFFGYYRDDGFVKRKKLGRIDAYGKWPGIKAEWLDLYRNRTERPGRSVLHSVTHSDEWCAEAYMETDYSALDDSRFISKLRDYAAFKVAHSDPEVPMTFSTGPASPRRLALAPGESAWKPFELGRLFRIEKGKRLTKADMVPGEIPYIGATDSNNGVTAHIANDEHLHEAGTISVSYNGSIAEAFYQERKFWATDDVNVLYPKTALSPHAAMFVCTIINMEKYRFCYGRKWDRELMERSTVRLPSTPGGEPDWKWMEDYIKGLPYSAALATPSDSLSSTKQSQKEKNNA
ncbi:MAG: N-6 DNA methylase [Kiritimatiellae bacterium]|nr:N-6 DNA methylase [Kiritimatiellia bacterium]